MYNIKHDWGLLGAFSEAYSKAYYKAYYKAKHREKSYIASFSNPIDAFNAYKQAKELYIKELANKWKDKIDIRAYNALMNYQVEITD